MITLRPVSQSLIQTATPNNRMNSHNQSIATTPRRVNLMKFPCWLLVLAALAVAPAAFAAGPYYWDNNSTTAGFGTAGGTWVAPTVSQWSTDGTGVAVPGASVTTATTDTSENFGSGATGLAAGTITVSGTVSAGPMIFASGSGAIALSGGTLTLPAAATITVSNAVTVAGADSISSIIAGAATSLTKAGTGWLTLSGANTFVGSLIVSAGALQNNETGGSSASTATWVVGNTANVNAMMNINSAGSISAYSLAIGGLASGFSNGRGAVYQSAGTVTLAQDINSASQGDLAIGCPTTANNAGGAYGYYNLSGGTMNVNSVVMHQGNNGGTTAYGVADITGGTLTIARTLLITRNSNGGYDDACVFNVLGGSASVTALSIRQGDGGRGHVGALTIGGGTGTASVATTASATVGLEIAGGNNADSTSKSVVNLLTGGTLQVGIVTAGTATTPTSFINFNGGTLKATATTSGGANFLTAANLGSVNIYSGGGTVDNNGQNITIGKALAAPTGSGLTGGTLTKGTGYIGAPYVEVTGGTATGSKLATAIAIMEDDTTGNGTYRVASIKITSPGTYSSIPTGVSFSGGGPGTAATFTSLTTAANTSGGMTFADSGSAATNTLTGANTYTGNTAITGGILTIGGSGQLAGGSYGGNISISGGATFNYNSSLAQTLSGTISGSGTLKQSGPGTLTIGNAGAGAITVAGGTLVTTSTQAGTGAASVNDGATLNVTVSGVSQWVPASLTLGSSTGATLTLNGITNAATTTAPIVPTAAVTLNGTITVNVTSFSGTVAVGSSYPLLGNEGGTTTGYTLGSQPVGYTGHLTASGSTLFYTVDTAPDVWNAATPGGNWNIATTANWVGNAVNNTPANTYAQNDAAIFNDSVGTPQTVALTAAVTPQMVVVANSSTAYTINSSGANIIGGSSALNKSGTAALTLSGNNTYSGGTTLSAGQLNINSGGSSSANSAIGTGTLTISGGTLDNTSGSDVTLQPVIAQNWNTDITYVGSANSLNLGTGAVTPNVALPATARTVTVTAKTLTVGGAIGGGTMGLTKAGAGTLTLSGANTFTGPTIVNAGTLTRSDTTPSAPPATATFTVGNAAANSVMNINGAGTLNAYSLAVGNTATGAVYQSSGTLALAQAANNADFAIGNGTGNIYGYYQLSGGTLTANQLNYKNNTGGGGGVMDVLGGTFTDAGAINILNSGDSSDSSATVGLLNVSGATAAATVTATSIAMAGGYDANMFSVVNVGTVGGGANAANLTLTGTGTTGIQYLNQNYISAESVVNLLPNGTLTASQIKQGGQGNNATCQLNFNGGTLKTQTGATGASFLAAANPIACQVFAGGGTVDNNGVAITIAQPLVTPLSGSSVGVTGVTLNNKGAGYIGAPFVQFTGGTPVGHTSTGTNNPGGGQFGRSGNVATAIAIMADDGSGNGTYRVDSIQITDPGSYTTAPAGVSFFGGGRTTATTITSISTSANTSGGMTFNGANTTTLTAANTYTGDTTINNGCTLALTGSGVLASVNIIDNGTYTPVSPYSLASGVNLKGTGSVSGTVNTVSGSAIYPATDGTAGTLTFSTLNMGSGGTAYFDLNNASHTSGNDQVSVSTALTLSGSTAIHIKAGSTSALDETGDYVLFSSATATTYTAPSLTYDGSVPSDSTNWGLLKIGNNVVLHYTAPAAPPLVLTTTYSPASPVYAGTADTASATVSSSGTNLTYQWQGSTDNITFTNIPNATNATLAIDTTSMGGATNYYLLVATDSYGTGTGTSAGLAVSAASAPIITGLTISPSTVNWGTNANISMTATYNGTLPITSYQWQHSPDNTTWTNLPGATASSLSFVNYDVQPADGGYYRVQAVNSVGTSNSASATLTVNTASIVMLDIGATAPTAGTYDISQFSITGDVGGPAGLNYFVDTGNPGQTFTTGSNYKGYTLNEVFLQYGGQAGGGTPSSYTLCLYSISGSTATLIGQGAYTNNNTTPTVFTLGDWIRFGGNITNNLNPNTTYAYMFSRNGGGWWHPYVASGNPYANGEICSVARTGGAVTLGSTHVYDATFLTRLSAIPNPLTITTNPVSASVSLGGSTNFTVAALSDGTLSYQWYVVTAGPVTNVVSDGTDGDGTVYSGAATATLGLANTVLTDNGENYYCAVTSTYGGGITSNSAAATLTVLAVPVVGTTAFSPVSPVYAGTVDTLSATVTGGTPGYTYQWQGGTDSITFTNIANATNATYALDTTGMGGTTNYYRLVATDTASQFGNGTGTPLAVSAPSVPIITGPVITPTNILVGGSASMTATYNGTLPMTSFQWQFSPDNTLWANISGATSSSYNVSGAVATQTGYYRVIAANAVGSATSGSAQLNVGSYLINPTTRNGSFETFTGANTFASGTVTNWAEWATGVANGGTTANENGHTPSQGAREGYLPYNEAIYNLTAQTIQAGDIYTYSWDYLVGFGGGGVNLKAELGYWNGSSFVEITNALTQAAGTAQQLGISTNWTVPPGDPSIGYPIGVGIINPNANYPALDNVVLTFVRAVNTLTITTNPVAAIVNLNDSTSFSVSASTDGTIAGYQWYVITAGPVTNAVSNGTSGTGTIYGGATTATLGLSSVKGADNGNQYYCAVTSSYGNTVNSTAAALTVLINPVVGAAAFSPVSPVYAGTVDTLSAGVTGGLPGYTYQWQSSSDNFVSTTNNIANATNATYALDTTGMGGTTNYYRLMATDSNTNSGTGPGAALAVNAPSVPIITGPVITPSTINAGGSASMTATYNGTLPMTSFQWQHSVDNTVWTNVTGATASSYNITGATPGQAGLYRVVAGNSVGSTTSSSAQLYVAQYLINPTTLNGSFEGGSLATFASGNVPNWTGWVGVASPVSGGTVATSNGHTPSQGTKGAELPYNSAVYDLTAHTIQAGEVYSYTWDYLVGFGGRANVELGYLSNGVFVAISSTLTTAVTTQQLGVGTTWTVPPGDPSIGYPIGVGIVNPNSNYPMVDNFNLTLIPLPNPLTITGPTPTTANVPVGGSTALSVSATSDATITGYQWYVGTPGSGTAVTNGADANGTVLGGVATATLGFSSAAIADNGNTYYCAVTSSYNGGTTSNSAAATLNVVPILSWLASPADMDWNQTSLNWTGGVAYNDPDFVVFDSTGSGGTINIPGTVLPGAVAVNSGTYTFSGSGKISGGTALSVTGTGNLTVSAANDYTGGTTLSGGQLNIGGSGVLGTGALTISGGTLDNSSGAAMTLSPSLTEKWNGNFTYAGSANSLNLGSGAVTLGGNRQVTVSAQTLTVPGVINDGGSNYSLTLAGGGTLVLSNYDTYTGNTTVNGGTLVLTKGGGTGTIINNLNINPGALVQLAVGDALGFNTGGCVTNINIVGGTLDATVAAGNESFRTSYKLTGGTMSSSGGTAAYNLDGASGVVVSSLATNVVSTISGNVVLRSSGVIFNVAQGTVSGGIDMVILGTVSGTGDTFTKSGSGTLFLSGHNSFSGATTINAGTLIVGNEWAVGTYNANITNNGTLIINNNSIFSQTLNGVISGTGSLIQNGSESLEISAANTYTGNTIVDGGVGGTLQIDQATLASTSTVIVTNGGGGNLILNFSVTNPVAYLVLNGVSQPAGVYNGGNSSGLITGAGSLQVLIGASAFSSNAQLTSLALTPAGTLYPAFATGTMSYNATNTCANNPLTVTVANADVTATNTLYLNGVSQGLLTNGVASGLLTLATGSNNVTVQVVSQDLSTTNDYVVAATLTAPPTVGVNSTNIYAGGTATLTATTSASSPAYSWSPGGATTASITVSPSTNTTYTVTVTDGTTGCANSGSGTVTILPSTNALLASLAITPAGTLFPTFATNVYSYNATNTYANKTVTVAAAGANTNATLSLNFNGGGYGAAVTNSLSIGGNTLVLPTNTVAVRVVSQDLSQTNTYTVNVLLQPSATVTKLTNSVSGSTLTLSWPADHLGYRLLVQTNNLNKGVSGNINDWGTVPGSQSITATNIAIIKTGVTNLYYKLVYP